MTSISVITSTFVTLFFCSIVPAETTSCSFDYQCTYQCCSGTCCQGYSSYNVDGVVEPWMIGVIVGGSVLGLIIVVSIIVCIAMAVKGSTTVVRPVNQPAVAVINTGGGTMAAPSGWAQPAYGPTGGGYPTQPTYGPTGGGYPTQTTYGPQLPGAPVPPPYTYNNPAFAPTQAPGPSQPSNDPFNEAAYGHKS